LAIGIALAVLFIAFGNTNILSRLLPNLVAPAEVTAESADADSEASTRATREPVPSAGAAEATMPAEVNGVPTMAYEDLPPEAKHTLDLIESDGPFPYDQDGVVFENREGLLPGRPKGYYREYTVETPGSDDRGARRIVTGAEGEIYYTDDHYDSFSYVVL
jgi:ribonuclease T1